VNKENKSK